MDEAVTASTWQIIINLYRVVENRTRQCFTAHKIVEPESSVTCGTILLTTMNKVGRKTLFSTVFINPEQTVNFLL